MAEKLSVQPEAPRHNPEKVSTPERSKSKELTSKSHEAAKREQQERLTASREAVERQAQSSEDLQRLDRSKDKNNTPPPPTKELQEIARARVLRAVRRQLPGPERVFSKFIHTKPVEAISAAGERTIARPYGLLGGGLAAFIGSTVTFYMAKHYGFKYNLFLFFTFFIAGYVIATVLEAIIRLFKRNAR